MQENAWQIKQKRGTRRFFTVLTAVTVFVIFICIQYMYQIRRTTAAETERYLSELSASVVYSVDARLQANLDALDSIALTYAELGRYGGKGDISYLQDKARVHKFVSVYVVSPDGRAAGSDGEEHDFSGIPQIMASMSGEKSIMNDALIYGETKNGFAYSVPIYESGQITGALVACNSTEWIRSLLAQTYFNGEGFFHIIDSRGDFIVKSDNPYSMKEKNSFFTGLEKGALFNKDSSLTELKELVSERQAGTIYFQLKADNIPKIGKGIPLSFDGYYLFLVVTEAAANRQFDVLLVKGIFNNIVIALLFAALAIVLFTIDNRNNRRLSELAFVDPVTRGYSQIRFETEAGKLIRKAGRGTYTFVSLNVSNFKLINDTFGTYDGNRILKHIHDVIEEFLNEDELICRSFSDNFDLLLRTDTQEMLLKNIRSIARRINSFNDKSDKKYYLLLTVGVYLIEEPGLSIVHIRDRANVARKSSKVTMGNELFTCMFYSELERQKQLRNKDLENKMSAALENQEFVVFFQPKVRLSDGAIAGAEALVRWNDREWGMIPPGEFIPFFEQNHFIIQVDLYVFEQVCRHLRLWLDEGLEPVPVSVNLSRVHLSHENFLQKFLEIQQKYGIPSGLLEMELTETVLSENLGLVTEVVEKIRQMGICCSIDDFGSGYSSLNLLKHINADVLKLDKAFFDSPDACDPKERVVIEAVVDMAKRLNMTTVAEGVETQAQMEFLKNTGCDMVQGYVISKPVDAKHFEGLVFGDRQ